jgi:hypothetical protein
MSAPRPLVIQDPVPPGPEPIPPGPGVPDPGPPDPAPPDPLPEPEPAPDDDPVAFARQSGVAVELRGSVAVLSGVVEQAEERARIAAHVASLATVSRVESNLRPPTA